MQWFDRYLNAVLVPWSLERTYIDSACSPIHCFFHNEILLKLILYLIIKSIKRFQHHISFQIANLRNEKKNLNRLNETPTSSLYDDACGPIYCIFAFLSNRCTPFIFCHMYLSMCFRSGWLNCSVININKYSKNRPTLFGKGYFGTRFENISKWSWRGNCGT